MLHPLADDPTKSGSVSYDGWEFDHGGVQRFYVGGMRWFMRQSGIEKIPTLAGYAEEAVATIANQTNWTTMPNSETRWDQMSPNQLRSARKMDHVFFQKAALVIVTCERALADKLAKGGSTPFPIKPEDIYSVMSIIPAVWNIDDFDKKTLQQLQEKYPEAMAYLREKSGQSASTIEHLATGHSVQHATAMAVKAAIDKNFTKVGCGRLRASPGASLGTKAASPAESIDAG